MGTLTRNGKYETYQSDLTMLKTVVFWQNGTLDRIIIFKIHSGSSRSEIIDDNSTIYYSLVYLNVPLILDTVRLFFYGNSCGDISKKMSS